MYSEMHGSWLSCLQSCEGCWVPVSGPSFPGNWMCPTLPLLPPRELPRCKDPWWHGAKAFGALYALHMQLPSLRGRPESTLRGEAKALLLLGHCC